MRNIMFRSVFLLAITLFGGAFIGSSLKPVLADQIRLGDLTIIDPWLKATQPGKPVTGGYLVIRNDGLKDDYLMGASAEFAGKTEIHEMKITNDIMQMRPLSEGLLIPAGEMVMLKPGGYHVMFMGLKHPLADDDDVEVMLHFKHAGSIRIKFEAKDQHSHAH